MPPTFMPSDITEEQILEARKILGAPPFLQVEGVINIRDFGKLPTNDEKSKIRGGVLFRSGELTRITDAGKSTLRDLGIKKIFDLRGEAEITAYGSATSVIDGVEVVPVSFPVAYLVTETDKTEKRLKKFGTDPEGAFDDLYSDILKHGAVPYRTVLHHLRDKPEEPCLVHCTAGKDRTGVIAAVIQMLLDAKTELIMKDYCLTEVGLEPALPYLAERFNKIPLYRDNWAAFSRSGRCEPRTIENIMKRINEEYGGVESYVKGDIGLTDEDIAAIRRSLLVS
ncbi:hypothetical protein SCHPADRAFT_998569 [Schizopora paradoxa]|uniref:Tyrosine specific protein phosphatases domain-containing protein n=1 Tax=Schizopora paradoxa TaxID=27342 RepID=A0A0H2RJT0_9AGAM|nr:hypothetical protein SCHPADRAFT_998569 [Schizopora paradoxa]